MMRTNAKILRIQTDACRSRRDETRVPEVCILEVEAGDGLVKHARMMEIKSNELQVRRSACADAALRAEMKWVEKMTVEERIKAALSLGRRFSLIQPTTKGK